MITMRDKGKVMMARKIERTTRTTLHVMDPQPVATPCSSVCSTGGRDGEREGGRHGGKEKCRRMRRAEKHCYNIPGLV